MYIIIIKTIHLQITLDRGDDDKLSKYGHSDPNFEVEAKVMPYGMNMLRDTRPYETFTQIPSYKRGEGTKRQKSLQGKGVDVIIYLQKYIKSIADFKCYDRDKFTAILIELEKGVIYRPGTTEADFGKIINVKSDEIYDREPGWYEGHIIQRPYDKSLITLDQQLIIQQGYQESYEFDKATLARLMHKYPTEFYNYRNSNGEWTPIPWKISKSTTEEELAMGLIKISRNRQFYIYNAEDMKIIKQLINRKCQLLGDSWQIVEL